MRAMYIQDDFYICLSNTDLEILKKERQITGFMVGYDIIWKFLIKIPKINSDLSKVLINKKNRNLKMELNKNDFEILFEKGIFSERIGSSKVYFYTEKYDLDNFSEKSSQINILAFNAKSDQFNYLPPHSACLSFTFKICRFPQR